jgi:hypothetical protein
MNSSLAVDQAVLGPAAERPGNQPAAGSIR